MKTTIINIALFLGLFSFTTNSFATKAKKLVPIKKNQLELDINHFCNYLENGTTKKAEGLYRSPDGRYVIALIKNNERGHDYIGVVCAADNKYWKRGEVKFNFVLTANNELEGYYYNSKGEYVPVNFTIDGDSLKTNQLVKIDVQNIKATLALN